MSQTTLQTADAKRMALLVEFYWHNSVARCARWDDDIVISGNTYTATPGIECDLGQQHGGVNDTEVTVRMRADANPAAMYRGRWRGTTEVRIAVCDPTDAATTRIYLWRGWITAATFNADGRPGVCRLTCNSAKGRLTVAIGLRATTTCNWPFGGDICGVAVSDQPGTCTAINGVVATITGITAGNVAKYRNGSVRRNGMHLTVRERLTETTFKLVDIPPAEWVGQSVAVRYGCDKSVNTCTSEYNNQHRFGGCGIAIPAYNPIFETQ